MRNQPFFWKTVLGLCLILGTALAAQIYFLSAFAEYNERYSANLFVFAATAIIAIFAVITWMRLMVGPISRVKLQAERIAQGNLVKTWGDENFSDDEVSSIGFALNRISEQISTNLSNFQKKYTEQGAILASMSEGVLAIDGQERVTHVNRQTR